MLKKKTKTKENARMRVTPLTNPSQYFPIKQHQHQSHSPNPLSSPLSLSLTSLHMEKPNFNGHTTTTTTNNNTTTRPTTFDGTQATRHGYNFRSSSSLQFTSSGVEQTRCMLRASALVLTFVAAIVMGTGKDETRVIFITDPATMKMSSFVETTQAKYASALV